MFFHSTAYPLIDNDVSQTLHDYIVMQVKLCYDSFRLLLFILLLMLRKQTEEWGQPINRKENVAESDSDEVEQLLLNSIRLPALCQGLFHSDLVTAAHSPYVIPHMVIPYIFNSQGIHVINDIFHQLSINSTDQPAPVGEKESLDYVRGTKRRTPGTQSHRTQGHRCQDLYMSNKAAIVAPRGTSSRQMTKNFNQPSP